MAGNEWVVKVTADVKGVLDASRQIGQAGKQAGQEFKQGFSGNEQTINGLRGRLSELNQTLEKTAIGSREFKQAQRELAAAQREVDKALSQTANAAKGLSGVFAGLGALGAGAAVAGFLKGSVDKAVELETISRKLSNTLGPQGAAGALGFARETADTLGLSFKDLANNFGSFTAAATAAGVPLKQQKDLFAAVAKSGQALGLSNDEISGSLLALQQVASKGTVSMEELRGQLGERLPIALAATAKGLGVSQQELIKLVESGRLTSSEFFPAITKGLNELSAGAGGLPTAAQGFAKLQNAWEDLQTSFGTNLLPAVTASVDNLVKALEYIKLQGSARELRESFGVTADEAEKLVVIMEEVQKKYGLSAKEAKNLLSNAIASTGATRDIFGELNLGSLKTTGILNGFGEVQANLNRQAKEFAATQRDIQGETNAAAAADAQRLTEAKKQNEEKAKELATQGQLTEAVQKTLKAEVDGRVQVQQAGLNLGQALIGLEESRYGLVKSRNDYELQEAQKRGASEREIDEIKRTGEAIEAAALQAKYMALVNQQGLEGQLLSLKQQQATLEADTQALEARGKLSEANLKLEQAQLTNNAELIKNAEIARDIALNNVDISNQKKEILDQIQPLEKLSVQANDEIARNTLRAKLEAMGLRIEADGTLVAARSTADTFRSYGDSMKVPIAQQNAFAQLAKDVGLDVRDTGRGYLEIGKNVPLGKQKELLDLANAVGAAVSGTGEEYADINNKLGESNRDAANDIKEYMRVVEGSSRAARTQIGGLASNMRNAANDAASFYTSLAAAAGLPPARFTGGPVDAGQTYRINDGPSGMSLGQEAFLSASGALSLINRPANSLWTPPSKGTVIPAAITSRLKESGALGGGAGVLRGGSDPAVAHLALAVGNLSQEVAELRRKAWNVSVGVRGDGSGLRLAKTTARMF
jgi:tape measure domain-containing protein